jgi:hypothetical protein
VQCVSFLYLSRFDRFETRIQEEQLKLVWQRAGTASKVAWHVHDEQKAHHPDKLRVSFHAASTARRATMREF